MKKSIKKLTLNLETVRNLGDSELAQVAGGAAVDGMPWSVAAVESVCVCHHPGVPVEFGEAGQGGTLP